MNAKWSHFGWRRYLFPALIVFGFCLPIVGQTEQEPPPNTEQSLRAEGQFEDILANWWRDYQNAKQIGDRDTQEKAYQKFLDLKRSDQSEIFELGAYLFLEEGFADLKLQKFDAARKEFHQALELNPYLWPARIGLAKIKRERDSDYGRFIHLNYEGLIRAFHPKNTYFLFDAVVWFLTNLLRVIFLAFAFLVLIWVVKYYRSFFATTVGAFEHRGFKLLYAQLLTMLVMVLPLLLGLDFLLALGLYLALFFPFLERHEKQVAIVGFLSWLLIPALLLMISNINYSRMNPVLNMHLSQYYQGDPAYQIKKLLKLNVSGELSNRTKVLMGKYYKQNNQFSDAINVYQDISSSSKYFGFAQINIGNIQVLGREYQQAISIYKSVTGDKITQGIALYNLSIVKAILGNHEESETYRSQAFTLNPDLLKRAGAFENVDERFLIEADPSPIDRVWDAMLGKGNPLHTSWFSRPGLMLSGLMAIVFLTLAWILSRTRNLRALAKPCSKCGMVFYINESPNGDWCSQCTSIYIRKEDLPSDAKINKNEQVQRYTRIKRWVINTLQCLIPGAKQLLRDQVWPGFFTLCIWAFLLVMCLYPVDSIPHMFMHYFQWPSFWAYLCFGVTAVFWLIFGLRGIWQED